MTMHSFNDDLDDFEDFDYVSTAAVRRILREQIREEQRLAGRRHPRPRSDYEYDDFEEAYPYDT